ncbi:hypothetical protein [Moorena bouillonii]|nr:hypothetical protein [Moorena bouillonii]
MEPQIRINHRPLLTVGAEGCINLLPIKPETHTIPDRVHVGS